MSTCLAVLTDTREHCNKENLLAAITKWPVAYDYKLIYSDHPDHDFEWLLDGEFRDFMVASNMGEKPKGFAGSIETMYDLIPKGIDHVVFLVFGFQESQEIQGSS